MVQENNSKLIFWSRGSLDSWRFKGVKGFHGGMSWEKWLPTGIQPPPSYNNQMDPTRTFKGILNSFRHMCFILLQPKIKFLIFLRQFSFSWLSNLFLSNSEEALSMCLTGKAVGTSNFNFIREMFHAGQSPMWAVKLCWENNF